MKIFFLSILFFLPFGTSNDSLSVNEDVAIIVQESVNVTAISKAELIEIYTLRRNVWSGGNRITVSDYKGSSEIRDLFYSYIDIRLSAIKRLWLKEQFTGRSLPPKVVKSVDEMTKLVINNPGTIGYVPVSKVPDGVKVLLVIKQ